MEIEAHFIKSPDFKTVPISGAYGGPLGNGQLNLILFTERIPIPTRIVLDVQSDGTVVEKSRDSKDGIIREVALGVMLDIDAAKAIHQLLGSMIEQQEKILTQKFK